MANKKSKLLLGLVVVFIMSLVFALTPLLMANADTTDGESSSETTGTTTTETTEATTYAVKVNDTEYTSLGLASNSLVGGCTVTLLSNLTDDRLIMRNDLTVTLDLNGHNIVCTDTSAYPYSPIVVQAGNLTIIDSTASEGSAGNSVLSTTKTNGTVYVSGGNVTINAGNYICYSATGQTVRTTTAAVESTVTINGGTYTSVGYGMQIESGKLIINGGVIKSSVSQIGETSYSPSIKGSVVVRAADGYTPVLDINGGYFTSVLSESYMVVYVVDKTTDSDYDYGTNVNITGGYFDTSNYTVSRYIKDGYELYENSGSTKDSYPYYVAEVEVSGGNIGYGYATMDDEGNVAATTLVSTYTDVSGAVYRANNLSGTDEETGVTYYGYVYLSASEGESITSSITIPSNYKIVLDLAGVSISVTGGTAIQVNNGAELIIIDSENASTVTSDISLSGTIRNAGGTLKIYGGTYTNTDTSAKNSAIIYSAAASGQTADSATTLIYGGTFNGNTSESSNGRVLYLSLGSATIYGGNFNTSALCYCSSESYTLAVCGGYYTTAPTTYLADGYDVAVNEEATSYCVVSQVIGGVTYDLTSGKIVLNINVNDVVTSSDNISVQVGEQEAGLNATISYDSSVYTIAQKVDATQLVDTISVVVTPVDGYTYTYTTSVKEYLNGIYESSSDNEKAVITALLDYASAVQQLNDSTLSGDALANGGTYTESTKNITASDILNAGYKKASKGENWNGPTLSGCRLILSSGFGIVLTYSGSLDGYTVTVTLGDVEYTDVTVSGSTIYINNLSALQLTTSNLLTVVITSTSDGTSSAEEVAVADEGTETTTGTYTSKTYGLYYARVILTDSTGASDAEKLMAQTLYVYATAVATLNSAS